MAKKNLDYHEYDVMTRFSLLSASDNLKKWSGFLATEPRAILISLHAPYFPLTKNVQLGIADLDKKSVTYWTPILAKISASDCDTFLMYLEQIVEEMKVDNTSQDFCNLTTSTKICATVIDELESIGTQNVTSISRDFSEIELKHVDESDRQHCVKITLPAGYPEISPKIETELPFPSGAISWPQRISEVYKMFVSKVDICSKFWDEMDDLDQSVKVIDPLQPCSHHYHRRILLEDNVAVHLIFNPLKPRALPTISFAGPDKLVMEYSVAADQDCNTWDDSLPILRNLKSLLNCEYMAKEVGSDEETSEQEPCPICYAYEFNEEIPEIVCVCGTAFHPQCLIDLFVSDVSKTSFRQRVVECLNCQMDIAVPHGSGGSDW